MRTITIPFFHLMKMLMNNKLKLITLICSVMISSLINYSSVLAECSWVLWTKKEIISFEKTGNPKQDIFWDLINAYPKYEQCLDAKKKVWQVRKKQAQEESNKYKTISKIEEVPFELIIKTYKDKNNEHDISMSWSENFYCLPGTLDPRERR